VEIAVSDAVSSIRILKKTGLLYEEADWWASKERSRNQNEVKSIHLMPSSRTEELRGSGAGSVTEQEHSHPKKAAGSLHLREALELRALK
jgi:hypothetical protein